MLRYTGAYVKVDPADIAAHIFADMQEKTGTTSVFLPNGGRLYLDVGDHPEYATAECTQIDELLAQDRVGDEILADRADYAERALGYHVHIFKNNVDTAAHSYGCHENYLVRRRRDFLDRLQDLIPFFVTRQLLVGAGCVYREPGTVRYEISQRARHMHGAISTSSTRTRPMINTRDEPHADSERFRRMHVIVGDSNMVDTTTMLKIGMTHAILNVLEDGGRLPALALAEPMQAIRQVTQDLSGTTLLMRDNGTTIRAIDIQEAIFESVMSYYQRAGWLPSIDSNMQYVFDLWKRALEAFASGDFSSVHTEIEWIAKYELITRYRRRHSVALNDDRIARLELAWHDISSAGLRPQLEKYGIIARKVSTHDLSVARFSAPQTSRARVRAKFIVAAQQHHRDYSVDWSRVRLFSGGQGTSVTLNDPFVTTDAAVDALIETMENQ